MAWTFRAQTSPLSSIPSTSSALSHLFRDHSCNSFQQKRNLWKGYLTAHRTTITTTNKTKTKKPRHLGMQTKTGFSTGSMGSHQPLNVHPEPTQRRFCCHRTLNLQLLLTASTPGWGSRSQLLLEHKYGYFCWESIPVVSRVMASQRYPHLNLWKLWVPAFAWQRGFPDVANLRILRWKHPGPCRGPKCNPKDP